MERRGKRYHLLNFAFPLTTDSVPGVLGFLCIGWGVLPCVLAPTDFLSLPQRAGYSLQELFHLTRSQVSQQRALALHVLAQVIGRVSALLARSCLPPYLTPRPQTSPPPSPGAHTAAPSGADWEWDKPRVIAGQVKGLGQGL